MAVSGSGRGIQIIVGADYNGRDLARAQRDLDKLKREAAGTSGAMGKFGAGMKNAVVPGVAAMGAAVAAAGIALAAFAVQLGVDAVRAAAEEEKALVQLQNALENVGQGFSMPAAQDFVDDLQRATGVADDQLFPALQKLVTATGDLGQAQDLLAIALDISAATGKDLSSVTGALAKASNGSTTALRRLTDGALDPAVLATGDLTAITQELTDLYGGSAEKNAQTFAGTLERLSVAATELLESFGEGFIEAFDDMGNSTDGMMENIKAAEPAMRDFGKAVGDLVRDATPLLVYLDDAIRLGKVFGALWVSFITFNPAPFLNALPGLLNDTGDAAETAIEKLEAVDGIKGFGAWIPGARDSIGGLGDAAGDAAAQLDDLNEILKKISGDFSFRDAMDDAKVAVSEFKGIVDASQPSGREFITNLLDMAEKAGEAAAATDNLDEKALILDQSLGILTDALDNVQMSPSAKQMLLDAFSEMTSSVGLSKDKVDQYQAALDALDGSKINITVTTTYTTAGDPGGYPYGDKPVPDGVATGGLITGPGTGTSDSIPMRLSNGEFVIRAAAVKRFGAQFFQALNAGTMPASMRTAPAMTSRGPSGGGLVINGGITVTAAPAERAEESLPRALRRAAFLAGMAA